MGHGFQMRVRLRHVHVFRDRHGRLRAYLRIPGSRKSIPLPGAPGSSEFMAAYQAGIAGETLHPEIGAGRTAPGTINAAIVSYFNSLAFARLAPETRRVRRSILERFRVEHGDKRVALTQRRHVDQMVAAKIGTPSAARNF